MNGAVPCVFTWWKTQVSAFASQVGELAFQDIAKKCQRVPCSRCSSWSATEEQKNGMAQSAHCISVSARELCKELSERRAATSHVVLTVSCSAAQDAHVCLRRVPLLDSSDAHVAWTADALSQTHLTYAIYKKGCEANAGCNSKESA